jgi:hypothetical protein
MTNAQYLLYLETELAKALETRRRLSRTVDGRMESWPVMDETIAELHDKISEIEMEMSARGEAR